MNISWLTEFGHRLFVAPRAAWPLAIARILLGIGIFGWSVSMWFDVSTFLGDNALTSPELASDLFRWIPLDTELRIRVALIALTACSLLIIAGWRSTIWLVAAFILLVAVQRRSTLIINSGDIILRNLTLLLAFTPCGAALSADRVRRHGREALFTAAQVAPWGLRLVQLQMMVVYAFAFWGKSGELWKNGSAVSTVFRLEDLQRFEAIGLLVSNVVIVTGLTWSTLLLEAALGGLLWAKRLRPALIVGGVLLHLMIDTFVLVGFFGIAMIAGLMTFLDAESVERWVRDRRAAQPMSPDEPADADAAAASSSA